MLCQRSTQWAVTGGAHTGVLPKANSSMVSVTDGAHTGVLPKVNTVGR